MVPVVPERDTRPDIGRIAIEPAIYTGDKVQTITITGCKVIGIALAIGIAEQQPFGDIKIHIERPCFAIAQLYTGRVVIDYILQIIALVARQSRIAVSNRGNRLRIAVGEIRDGESLTTIVLMVVSNQPNFISPLPIFHKDLGFGSAVVFSP